MPHSVTAQHITPQNHRPLPTTSPDTTTAAHAPRTASPPCAFLAPFGVDERFVPDPVPAVVPLTVAAALPTVGLGAAPFLPFMAVAVLESVAKPTAAGFERKTE